MTINNITNFSFCSPSLIDKKQYHKFSSQSFYHLKKKKKTLSLSSSLSISLTCNSSLSLSPFLILSLSPLLSFSLLSPLVSLSFLVDRKGIVPMTTAMAMMAACCSVTGECRDRRDFRQIKWSRVACSASFFLWWQEWLPLHNLLSLSHREWHEDFTPVSWFQRRQSLSKAVVGDSDGWNERREKRVKGGERERERWGRGRGGGVWEVDKIWSESKKIDEIWLDHLTK